MKNRVIEKSVLFMLAISIVAVVGMMINRGFGSKDVSTKREDTPIIKVEIRGEVKNEGVYSVPEGSRICDVIYAAGGITKKACLDNIDPGAVVMKKTVINIPSLTQTQGIIPAININTADESQLCLIPGIGEVLAERIIEYRDENGDFGEISEIKSVDGIGKKKYEEIKDYIITEETQK